MDDVYINSSKIKRDFHLGSDGKHIRDASTFIGYEKMAEEGLKMVRARKGQRNTLIFMNSYQLGLFKTQKHTFIRQDRKWDQIFESTTSFPAVDVLSDGTVEIYSQAKFQYSGSYGEKDGILWINHVFGLTQGTLVEKIDPPKPKVIKFE